MRKSQGRRVSAGRRSDSKNTTSSAGSHAAENMLGKTHRGEKAVREQHEDMVEYAYPFRPDFMARLAIPRDATTDEINRLVAWARTLAVDYKPPS